MADNTVAMGGKTVFHEIRTARMLFDQKEWGEYCSASRQDDSLRIRTQIGKYLWNDFDICLNPEVMSLVVDGKSYGNYVTIKWADCGNGFWSSAIDYGYCNGGGGSGVSYADRLKGEKYDHREGYRSEQDAKVAACDAALSTLYRITNPNDKVRRLIKMVEDFKKSVRPKYVQLELF